MLVPIAMLFIAYSNTFNSPPVLDDFHSFIEPPALYLERWSLDSIMNLSQTEFGWFRLIPMITFSWDHWWGRGSLVVFHLTNILIHLGCIFAVYFLIYQLSKTNDGLDSDRSKETVSYCTMALWVMGMWGLNPVQTNAVTYLVQRMASLVTLFYVLSVASYLVARRLHIQGGPRLKTVLFYFATGLFTVASFLCKQNAFPLPLMLVFTELWFFQAKPLKYIVGNFGIKQWLAVACLIVVSLIVALHVWPIIYAAYSHRYFTLQERLLTEARVVCWYMSILLFPAPDRLSFEHDVELSTSLIHPPTTMLSIILLLVLVWATFHYRRRFRLASYGMLWFLVNLMIESSVVGLELVFEHRLYLPSIGFMLAIVFLAHYSFHKIRTKLPREVLERCAWCSFCILIAALTLATFFRNEAWRTPVSIYQDAVSKAPLNPRAHVNLAVGYQKVGRYEEAIAEANEAIELGKRNFEVNLVAANVLIVSWSALNEYERAIKAGEEALAQRTPDTNVYALPGMYLNLSNAHLHSNQLAEGFECLKNALKYYIQFSDHAMVEQLTFAIPAYVRAAAIKNTDLDGDGNPDPGHLPVDTWVSRVFLSFDERKIAIKLLESALAESPQDQFTLNLLSEVRSKDEADRLQEVKGTLESKYVMQPFSLFNASMAVAFLTKKVEVLAPLSGFGEMMLDYALSLRPDSADAHLLKGWYHHNRNESQEAVAAARRAIELDPECARAWLGLGFFLAQANLKDEAVEAFSKSLDLYPGCPDRNEILAFSQALAVAKADERSTSQSEDRPPESLELNAGVHPAMHPSATMSPSEG